MFIEQLCLVTPQMVSHHLRGEACASRILTPLHPPVRSSPPASTALFCSMLGIHGLQTKQANKQNNRKKKKKPSPRQGWSGLWLEMERDLVCSQGQFHFTVMAEKASQDMAIPRPLFNFQWGVGGSGLPTLTHHPLTQYTAGCSHSSIAFT